MTNKSMMRFGCWLAATFIAPIIVMSIELCLTRHFNVGTTDWDFVGLALSVIVGLFCLWQLPVSITKRAWLTVAFVPVSIGALIFYSLFFVCVVFGDCL
jgi:uncharacterized membrane protein YczE